jgi:hypothetical protein
VSLSPDKYQKFHPKLIFVHGSDKKTLSYLSIQNHVFLIDISGCQSASAAHLLTAEEASNLSIYDQI